MEQEVIIETETHLVDTENLLYLTKIDLFKKSDQLVGFKVVCQDRVVECHLDDGNNPIFKVPKLEEDDKSTILIEGFKNVGKQWTNDDVKQTSKKLKWTEKSDRMKLLFLDIIDEDGFIWLKKIPQRPPKTKQKERKGLNEGQR